MNKKNVVRGQQIKQPDNNASDVLCVDLDGTLVKTDTLVESCVALLRQCPSQIFLLPLWICKGRAFLKQKVASVVNLDPNLLPYRQELLEYLQQEKKRGRRIVLATAASRPVAEKVAAHLKLFDEVLSSDETCNLKGVDKAKALTEKFGRRGFCYAGNDRSDLPIWAASRGAIAVDASSSVLGRILKLTSLEYEFPGNHKRLKSLIKAMRPYQWVKNLLVFVPILTSGALAEMEAWSHAGLIFSAFCLTASGFYLLNDVLDIHTDRNHPVKKERPFASGALPLQLGLFIAPLLVAAGLGFAAMAGGVIYLIAYALTSFLYSVRLKGLPLVDIFTLAALYSLRLFAGGAVTGHAVSFWLLAFSSFFFLSLAVVKRVAELTKNERPVRGYLPQDRQILQVIGVGAGLVSSNLLALYVQSDAVIQQHQHPKLLWAIVPLMLFFQCRLWLSTARGYMRDDPVVYAATDWVTWIVGIALAAILIASFIRF
jgi:4-hydroxybenzoate polyprenyltransferase